MNTPSAYDDMDPYTAIKDERVERWEVRIRGSGLVGLRMFVGEVLGREREREIVTER